MRNKFVWTHQRHEQKIKSKTKILKCKLWGLTQDHKVKSLMLYQLG
jgi:hypothetical protein